MDMGYFLREINTAPVACRPESDGCRYDTGALQDTETTDPPKAGVA
jgi:hypothetical protein